MSVTFHLPTILEDRLLAARRNIAAEAKEAYVVALYRRGEITRPQLGAVLGLSRFEADALLKAHGVTEDLLDADELAGQLGPVDPRAGGDAGEG